MPAQPTPTRAPSQAVLHRRHALALLCATGWSGRAGALSPPSGTEFEPRASEPEPERKAAFLFNFLAFVDWPVSAYAHGLSPHVVGVLGADAVHAALLKRSAGRRQRGRPVEARRLAPGEALQGVHLLHRGRAAAPGPDPAPVVGQPLLLVTDEPRGLPAGSALNFITVRGRLRFDAAPATAARQGLRLSAQLLTVAERVVAR